MCVCLSCVVMRSHHRATGKLSSGMSSGSMNGGVRTSLVGYVGGVVYGGS